MIERNYFKISRNSGFVLVLQIFIYFILFFLSNFICQCIYGFCGALFILSLRLFLFFAVYYFYVIFQLDLFFLLLTLWRDKAPGTCFWNWSRRSTIDIVNQPCGQFCPRWKKRRKKKFFRLNASYCATAFFK